MTAAFDDDGFAVLPALLSPGELARIDDCGVDDGPLNVVAGSHRHGRLDDAAAIALRDARGTLACPVSRGGAMLMRPLLLHASSKATGSSRRRVLHFLFGPPALPCGLRWAATSFPSPAAAAA